MNIGSILIFYFYLVSIFLSSKTIESSAFMDFVECRGKILAPTYQKRNCVQFMDAILFEYLSIDKTTSDRIYIRYDLDYIKKLYYKKDTAIISGVCAALVDCNKANWVKVEQIQQGDIVQYWTDDGFFNGHCGVFWGKDEFGNFLLKGSHPDSKGYGIMNMYNMNFKMKIFCVRIK